MTGADLFTAASFAVTVLANGIWESILLAGLVLLVFRSSHGANATTRHAILVIALIGSLALPVLTTAIGFTRPATAPAAASSDVARRVSSPSRASLSATPSTPVNRDAFARSGNVPSPLRPHVAVPRPAIVTIVALWLIGVSFFGVRLVVSLLYLERLKRDALPLPVESRTRLERWATIGKGRNVRLCRSHEIMVPIAVGLFDGMILIPEHLLEELPSEDLDRIVLHELAHLRRQDDWINALERVAEALFFFNPAIRWMIRQLDLEREVACDDWVLERRNDALPYAQCLVKLVESIAWPHRPMAAPGVFVTRRAISVRIERLLAAHRDVRIKVSAAPMVASMAVTLAAFALCAYVSPSFASAGAESSSTATASPNGPRLRASTAATKGVVAAGSRRSLVTRQVARVEPTAVPTAAPTAATSSPSATPAAPPSTEPTAMPVRGSTAAMKTRNSLSTRTNVVSHAQTHAQQSFSIAAGNAGAWSAGAGSGAESAASAQATGGDYISQLADAGYTNLSADDLIHLRSLGVTADYIRAMAAAGFGHPPVDQLVKMRAVGVTPAFAHDMRKFFSSASTDELIEMRAVGVTPEYVSGLQSSGLGGLTAESVKSMRAIGVDAAYIRDLAAAGYAHLNAEQLTKLRAIGVDRAFLGRLESHGFHKLDIDKVIEMKATGVLE
jgi:bla regulator protein blaR1